MGVLDALIGNGTGLGAGDRAPDFTRPDQDGNPVTLSGFRGHSNVIAYFYPKDDSPVCTRESCAFRDQYTAFSDAGAEVLGISSDSAASHKAFAKRHELPFRLLSDEAGRVRRVFRVPSTLGLLPGRVTYVIDKQGVIRHAFNSQLAPTRHVEEALAVLRTLA
jgi:peroxiredoxin Q/BCP